MKKHTAVKTIGAKLLVLAGLVTAFSAAATTMNFDGGLITSDGNGDISLPGYFTNAVVDGRYAFVAKGTTVSLTMAGGSGGFNEGDIKYYTAGNYGNEGSGFETMAPAAKFSFNDLGDYSGMFRFWVDNPHNGNREACAIMGVGSAGFDQDDGVGGVAIGVDWLTNSVFSMPSNGLVVEGSVGIGTQTPAYNLDVVGDVNFTGSLLNNGDAVIQPDTAGNGGTTLMLRAQDDGTPMYLHVLANGSSSWTTAP